MGLTTLGAPSLRAQYDGVSIYAVESLVQSPSCSLEKAPYIRRWEIDLIPPRGHEIAVMKTESNRPPMEPFGAVAFFVGQIEGIIARGIDRIADQDPSSRCPLPQPREEPSCRPPVPRYSEISTHEEDGVPCPVRHHLRQVG